MVGCGCVLFFQGDDGIRGIVRCGGLGEMYKREVMEGTDTVMSSEGGYRCSDE